MRTHLHLALISALALATTGVSFGAPAADGWPDAGPASSRGGIRWLGPKPPAAPRRVVSLAPSVTDTVVALGFADRLVGVTRYDTAPEVASRARIGGFLDPSPEAVLALRPDLCLWFTDGGAYAAVQRIADLGVPVLAMPVVGVQDLLTATRALARALGDNAAGERLAGRLEAAIASTRARAARLPHPRVLFLVGREPLVAAGPGSYPDELLRIAGGVNVVDGRVAWPVWSAERAVASNPDLVLDGAVLERGTPGGALAAIPAVQRGDLRKLANDDPLRPGPRLAPALEAIFAAVHPAAPP
jgi:iron complex transport system substrate-binding protein